MGLGITGGKRDPPFAKSDPVQNAPHLYSQPLPKPLKASQTTIPVGWATSSGFTWESPPGTRGGTLVSLPGSLPLLSLTKCLRTVLVL